MTSNTLTIGAVLLTAGLTSPQGPVKVEMQEHLELQEHMEFQRQHEMEMKLQQIAEMQAIGVRVPLEAKAVKGAPYSAELVSESVQVLPDGNRIVHRSTGRVYRDSEGRTRREQDLEPGRPGHVTITDPVAKVSYSLDPETRVAWQTPAGIAVYIKEKAAQASDPAELELRRKLEAELAATKRQQFEEQKRQQAAIEHGVVHKTTEPEWEQKVEKLPARQIEGVTAEGTRTTRTFPAGAIGNEQPIVTVTEEWRSPELQVLVLTRTNDPRTGESTYQLLSVSRAEPSPAWFEVPADYTVKETGIRKAVQVMERKK